MINHSKEISQVRPEVPKELRIALSGVHWERLIDQSMSNERTTLIAVDEKSDVLPTERVSGDRIITLPSSVLLASGAKISPDLEGGGWIIDNFDPQILTRESSGGLLTHSAFSSSSQFGSLLPAALRPDWLIEYPALVSEIAKRPLDQLSGWMRLRGHELVERFEGLRERYPERALVPLFARAAGEDLLCLERGNGDILVQVHDFAEPGFEGSAKVGPVHSWWEGMEQKLAEQYQRALSRIVQDERYAQGLGWGKARKGQPEGTVEAH
ncbi:MAG: hypothetical protein KDD64_14835, partial [Bdellovibrionales bacterium]|nr:hypothetical protein [Bdellovibrionales bacterium]